MSFSGKGCCAQMSAVSRTRFASWVFMKVVGFLGRNHRQGFSGAGSLHVNPGAGRITRQSNQGLLSGDLAGFGRSSRRTHRSRTPS
jgi:hypothetical protein